MSDLEYCCKCDEPTGRAGKGDDSTFLADGTGPYCVDCYYQAEVTRLRAENAELREQIQELTQSANRVVAQGFEQEREIDELRAQIAEHEKTSNRYYELLYQVENVVPGETRHETAKRIIHEHETRPATEPRMGARLPGEER